MAQGTPTRCDGELDGFVVAYRRDARDERPNARWRNCVVIQRCDGVLAGCAFACRRDASLAPWRNCVVMACWNGCLFAGEMQQMLGRLLKSATADTSDVDVHDRALFYYRCHPFPNPKLKHPKPTHSLLSPTPKPLALDSQATGVCVIATGSIALWRYSRCPVVCRAGGASVSAAPAIRVPVTVPGRSNWTDGRGMLRWQASDGRPQRGQGCRLGRWHIRR